MRWLLRSAIFASGFGVGPLAHARLGPPLEETSAPPAVPAVSVGKPAPPQPISVAVPAAVAKPAPPQTVTPVREPIRQVRGDEPPDRPDRLPPTLPPLAPPKPAPKLSANGLPLPAPSAALPTIPVAPTPAPRAATAPKALPPFPATASAPTKSAPALGVPTKLASEPLTPLPSAATNPVDRVCEVGCDAPWRLCPQDGVRARGWLSGGYVYNSSNPDSKYNGPYNAVDRSAEPMFNQAYLIVDRALPQSGFGAGFRVDALFGTDHFLAQSRGFEVDRDFGKRWNGEYYGVAIPQAYAEVGTDRVSLKLGHFYTTVGYEGVPAPANFFYTRAYSYQFGQPFTHWGGLLTWRGGRNWEGHAGLVNGWDALVGRANNANLLAGLKYTADSGLWWSSFALVSGQEQNNLARLPFVIGTDGNRSRYSFLIGLTPGGLAGRWEYVFHNYYGFQENATPQGSFARWYGVDQYLYYRVSRELRMGVRAEWFRDEDGTRVGLNRRSNPNNPPLPGNYFAFTYSLNYAPTSNLTVRPELRWDFTSDSARRPFNDGKKNNQLLLGCDVVWQF